ncbi:PRTRC system ThiF family protein [Chitinophaga arvensicola]|uniref:PRTRC system ThiF family protein n=1 Tax=Chitinophaga arvensicola TaxID=29529 RepID=A0A1I0PQ50_9BACT|nr:PRTRC system ThiF family protein [Chitinophaga arvensicola]SEW16482.1 PRTRC system ThiF family protein [Chitinophaga arvensicola]
MNNLEAVHYLHPIFLQPPHPITVNIIGAGGTGSHFCYALANMAQTLLETGHPAFFVKVYDEDTIQKPNIGRTTYSRSEIGLNKAVAIVNRINHSAGLTWQAVPKRYDNQRETANMTITCVHTKGDRVMIGKQLTNANKSNNYSPTNPLYWLDCGNATDTGQAILSTVTKLQQPKSNMYLPVGYLPLVTEEYGEFMVDEPDTPSCSVAEAISKQDLFINPSISLAAIKLLWQYFKQGMSHYRGVFVNNRNHSTVGLPIKAKY